MAFFDKVKFKLWDGADAVVGLINQWEPKNCKTEKDYEKSLVKFIRAELPDIEVTPQFSFGRTKADLVIGRKVIIEIKTNLSNTGSCQRLVGQLHDYSEWEGKVIVLLTGTTCPDLKMKINKAIKDINANHSGPLIIATKMMLIEK
jgi:hypothetical protein